MIFRPYTARMNAESRVNFSGYFHFKYHWKRIYHAVSENSRERKCCKHFLLDIHPERTLLSKKKG